MELVPLVDEHRVKRLPKLEQRRFTVLSPLIPDRRSSFQQIHYDDLFVTIPVKELLRVFNPRDEHIFHDFIADKIAEEVLSSQMLVKESDGRAGKADSSRFFTSPPTVRPPERHILYRMQTPTPRKKSKGW